MSQSRNNIGQQELLNALAAQKEIQILTPGGWPSWETKTCLEVIKCLADGGLLFSPTLGSHWRIKPKPDIVQKRFIEFKPTLDNAYNASNVEYTFEAEHPHVLKSVKMI